MTHQEMRKVVEKALKRPVSDKVWDFLEGEEYVTQAIEEEETVKGEGVKFLLEKIRALESLSRTDESAPKVVTEKETPPDKRFWAFTQIVACLGNKNEEVQRFRKEVLGDRLLSPDEIQSWIETQAEKENSPVRGEMVFLEYLSLPSQWVYRTPISKKGTLGRLKRIAAKFKGIWDESKAVYFILTGQALPVSPAKIKTTYGAVPRITIEVSPHLKPEEVAKIYSQAKRKYEQFAGQKRKLKEKNLMLAVFGVEEEGSWGQLLIKWNKKYPEWAYKDRANFAKDVKAAFENITGWEWKTAPFNKKMDRASFEDLLREFNAK